MSSTNSTSPPDTSDDSESPRVSAKPDSDNKHHWGLRRWLAISMAVAVVLGIQSIGPARFLGGFVGVLIFDFLFGGLLCEVLFKCFVVPFAVTLVTLPISLLFPGDPDATHLVTVRGRWRSIAKMWQDYWSL